MKKSRISFALLGIVVGIVFGLILSNTVLPVSESETGGEKVAQKILDAYRLANPGANLEIMDVEVVNGLYRVRLSTGQEQGAYQTVYATLDGEMFTQTLTNLTQYQTQLENRKGFLDCLRENNVTIYGGLQVNNTQVSRASALQIQLLGGTNYLNNIYIDCSNNLQACVNEGVESLPSVKYNEEVYPGVKQYQWFSENVGCEIE